jgi:hypothetical protein
MPTERELVERRARVVATAYYVWKSKADAQQFLNTPHSLLDGRTPLDASMTEPGARRVEEWRLHLLQNLGARKMRVTTRWLNAIQRRKGHRFRTRLVSRRNGAHYCPYGLHGHDARYRNFAHAHCCGRHCPDYYDCSPPGLLRAHHHGFDCRQRTQPSKLRTE